MTLNVTAAERRDCGSSWQKGQLPGLFPFLFNFTPPQILHICCRCSDAPITFVQVFCSFCSHVQMLVIPIFYLKTQYKSNSIKSFYWANVTYLANKATYNFFFYCYAITYFYLNSVPLQLLNDSLKCAIVFSPPASIHCHLVTLRCNYCCKYFGIRLAQLCTCTDWNFCPFLFAK